MSKSNLPFGAEFSPSQIDLVELLRIVKENEGDLKAIEARIKAVYFSKRNISDANKDKLALNTRIALQSYQLITESGYLTEVGNELYSYIRESAINEDVLNKMYLRFAQHIYTRLGGHLLVEAIRYLRGSGLKVTREAIKNHLRDYYGIYIPPNGRHISTMKLWLEKAGILTKNYEVNEGCLEQVLNVSKNTFADIYNLTEPQRDFLRALATMLETGRCYSSSSIVKKAMELYGTKFPEGFIPKEILYPLQAKGFITLERGTKEKGRGAKPFKVCPTEKFKVEVLRPILDDLANKQTPLLIGFAQKTLKEILDDLNSQSKHKRGMALEALALNIMFRLGLRFVDRRRRASDTGGAEVDLLFESDRLFYSRWQVQCKNTNRVGIEDIIREVGVQPLLKSNVIVLITTGVFTKQAWEFAAKIMRYTNIAIIMIDGTHLKYISEDPTWLMRIVQEQIEWARKVKE